MTHLPMTPPMDEPPAVDWKRRVCGFFESDRSYREDGCSLHTLVGERKLILYGAGDGFITFSLFILKRHGITPAAILDRAFASRGSCHGIPAFPPSEYEPTEEDRKNAVVAITVGKREFHEEIFGSLSRMGFDNILLSTDIYEYHVHYPPKELGEKGFGFYVENQDNILRSLDLFEDDLSRRVFTAFVQTHMERRPLRIPKSPPEEQYFPCGIPLDKGYSRFINCGAYHGDTVMSLNDRAGKVESVVCFEPDRANFESLSRYLAVNADKIAHHVFAYPCGVYSSEAQLAFAMGNLFNSRISDGGGDTVQCVAIDHALPGFKPTFINMDIEGAEMEALKGAERTLRESRPDLAVCVYHSPSHIWEIPLYIHSLKLGYRFYLRNYTSFISETVLYATARDEEGQKER